MSFLKVIKLFITILFLLVVSATALEFSLRHIYRNLKSTDDASCFITQRWMKSFVLNEFGMRHRKIEPEKAYEGINRVALLGDGISFGRGVTRAARYADVLEKKMKDRKVDLLNFSEIDGKLRDYFRQIPEIIETFGPDMFVIQLSMRDLIPRELDQRRRCPDLIDDREIYEAKCAKFITLELANFYYRLWRKNRGDCDNQMEFYAKLFSSDQEFDLTPQLDYIKEIDNYLHEYQFAMGFVLFPEMSLLGKGDYPLRPLHRLFKQYCKKNDINCLDLLDAYTKQKDKHFQINQFETMPNERAHAIAVPEIELMIDEMIHELDSVSDDKTNDAPQN